MKIISYTMNPSFLLLLLLSALSFQSDASTLHAVHDIDGRTLKRGTEYYILPLIRGRSGGLTMADRNNTCPLYVAQEISEVDNGLPTTFSPVYPKENIVRLSTDMNVQFSAASICVQSTVWRLNGPDETTGRQYVSTAGVKGNPGRSTVSNWFRIDRYDDNYYKLVFCPGVCDVCRVLCGELGVFSEGGRRWLGFGGEPFPVMFKRKLD